MFARESLNRRNYVCFNGAAPESIPPELAEARQKLEATIQVLKNVQETYAAAAEAALKLTHWTVGWIRRWSRAR